MTTHLNFNDTSFILSETYDSCSNAIKLLTFLCDLEIPEAQEALHDFQETLDDEYCQSCEMPRDECYCKDDFTYRYEYDDGN